MKGEEKREEFSETAETGEEICGDGAKAEEVDAIFSRASKGLPSFVEMALVSVLLERREGED
ncbi:hypothetical protein AGABI2DRAFT_133498 [Agaricus bisporus var. bisporus H97]|uniref:hypothetical protein n=1 Tax=Agaricus bisporus var. bisporus (strain H97 / ATCC MYA-4626 / FGSC 10389) TaxID=936046 RepID=UPI00029F7F44|nr:hypothetical protein AGABI2DRAFT_133498 [Agaricus bisporus var. bisporus H97]EKV51854.1 hypothetical protein AGABI2DRAFT_133498 [Agaricus bisporus var. bisporus H97]